MTTSCERIDDSRNMNAMLGLEYVVCTIPDREIRQLKRDGEAYWKDEVIKQTTDHILQEMIPGDDTTLTWNPLIEDVACPR